MKPKSRACITKLDHYGEIKEVPSVEELLEWCWPKDPYNIELQNAVCLMVLNGDPPPKQLDLFYCNPSEIGPKKGE